MSVEAFTPEQALAEGIGRTAIDGRDRIVISSDERVIWVIEADSKVDDDDLVFPVIVHTRGGLSSDALAVLIERVDVA